MSTTKGLGLSRPRSSGTQQGGDEHYPVVIAWLVNLFRVFFDVIAHYKVRLDRRLRPVSLLRRELARATDVNQYEDIAERLDYELGNDVWRRNSASRRYDHRVIFSRLQKLRAARVEQDSAQLVYLLRTGLLRNLANIGDKSLYDRSYLGTKLLVGEYVGEVMQCLEYVAALPNERMSQESKLQFFKDTKHSYGLTALVLQGGAAFGLFHIGVVKALWHQGLLPTVLSGTAIGALVAAQVCTATDNELTYLLSDDKPYDLHAFESRRKGQTLRKLKRFWNQGFLLDISVLAECCRDNLGEVTFEEAFKRSNRVLNITIHATTSQTPSLLNYLTAPNVLVWTAALASNALPGLYEPVDLLCRDSDGEIVPWAPLHGVRFAAASTGTPYERVSELFNVNNFIISQARPYLVPFLSAPLHRHRSGALWIRLLKCAGLELEHRISQLAMLGLVPFGTRLWVRNNLKLPRSEITLVPPDLGLWDFTKLLRAPTNDDFAYWALKGERATWPALGLIKVRCLIEVGLREIYEDLRHREATGGELVDAAALPDYGDGDGVGVGNGTGHTFGNGVRAADQLNQRYPNYHATIGHGPESRTLLYPLSGGGLGMAGGGDSGNGSNSGAAATNGNARSAAGQQQGGHQQHSERAGFERNGSVHPSFRSDVPTAAGIVAGFDHSDAGAGAGGGGAGGGGIGVGGIFTAPLPSMHPGESWAAVHTDTDDGGSRSAGEVPEITTTSPHSPDPSHRRDHSNDERGDTRRHSAAAAAGSAMTTGVSSGATSTTSAAGGRGAMTTRNNRRRSMTVSEL